MQQNTDLRTHWKIEKNWELDNTLIRFILEKKKFEWHSYPVRIIKKIDNQITYSSVVNFFAIWTGWGVIRFSFSNQNHSRMESILFSYTKSVAYGDLIYTFEILIWHSFQQVGDSTKKARHLTSSSLFGGEPSPELSLCLWASLSAGWSILINYSN